MTTGIYEFGESLAAQTMALAELAAGDAMVHPAVAATVRNVALTVAGLVEPAKKAFEAGEHEAGMYALGCMDGACRLIALLMTNPDDPLVVEMSKPFLPKVEEVAQ